MRVQTHGSKGQVLVLLHGIPGSGNVWSAVASELARDHRVLVPDLLGFGASPRPAAIDELWVDAQASALHAELVRAGVDRAVLVGHDFGGPVALALAGLDAGLVSGLCLASANVFTDTPIPLPIRLVTLPFVGGAAAAALFSRPSLRMMLRQGSQSPLDEDAHLGDDDQVSAIGTIFAAALRELASRYAFAEPVLRGLDVPILVAWGERDPFFGTDQARRTAAAAGPRARLSIMPGAGHFLPGERPAELAAELRALAQEAA